jgi:hypothetical protein
MKLDDAVEQSCMHRRKHVFLDLAPSRLRRAAAQLLKRTTHPLAWAPAAAPMQRHAADPSHLITPMTPDVHAVGYYCMYVSMSMVVFLSSLM